MNSYLYLNVYSHPKLGHLLYAGSCSRKDNVRGKINKTYHGSSSYVKRHSWDKYLMDIIYIKDTTDLSTMKLESELINVCCRLYGILPQVKECAHRNGNYWVDNYPDGIMLNAHNNTLEHCHLKLRLEGQSELQKEVSLRTIKLAAAASQEALKTRGATAKQKESAYNAALKHAENFRKFGQSKAAKDAFIRMQRSKIYDDGLLSKIQNTRKERYSKDSSYGRHRKVRCIETGMIGTIHKLCGDLGVQNLECTIRRHLNKGELVYKHPSLNLSFEFV